MKVRSGFLPAFHRAGRVAWLLVLAVAAFGQGTDLPPAAGFAPGWNLGERLTFEKGGLFDYIDGGAELFLEFGFKRVLIQRYVKAGAELTLEAYEMTDADAALGVYLMKCGLETPVDGLPVRNTGEPAQLTILKGRFFLHVNSFSVGAELLPEMIRLARSALDAVPDERPGRSLDLLPVEGLIAGSARLIRGPYALQSIVTLGEGDILSQGGRVIAAAGDYRAPAGLWTLVLAPYPDEAAASSALAYLRAHLDSYLEVTAERAGGFVFRDFKQKFGLVLRKGAILELRLGLQDPPG
jgi:hypothetical protein